MSTLRSRVGTVTVAPFNVGWVVGMGVENDRRGVERAMRSRRVGGLDSSYKRRLRCSE